MIACKKCGSVSLFIKENGTQTGVYCSDCGSWIKWVGKEEKRLVERQINDIAKEENNDPVDLSQFSNEELLSEIARRMK